MCGPGRWEVAAVGVSAQFRGRPEREREREKEREREREREGGETNLV